MSFLPITRSFQNFHPLNEQALLLLFLRFLILFYLGNIIKISEAQIIQEKSANGLLENSKLNSKLFHYAISDCSSNSKFGFKLGSDWMSLIPDDQMLSRINIPGTHDSAARWGIRESVCQKFNLSVQMGFGIRIFKKTLSFALKCKGSCYDFTKLTEKTEIIVVI